MNSLICVSVILSAWVVYLPFQFSNSNSPVISDYFPFPSCVIACLALMCCTSFLPPPSTFTLHASCSQCQFIFVFSLVISTCLFIKRLLFLLEIYQTLKKALPSSPFLQNPHPCVHTHVVLMTCQGGPLIQEMQEEDATLVLGNCSHSQSIKKDS